MIDGSGAGHALPERQDVHGEIIDLRGELGMLEPDIVDLGGRHRDRGAALHPLNLGDEVLDRGVGVEIRARQRMAGLLTEDRLVADDDAVDVAVVLGEGDSALDLLLVLLFPIVEPDALSKPQAVGRCQWRHLLHAVGRAIGPDVLRIGRDRREVGLDLLLGDDSRFVNIRIDRGEGNAREHPAGVGGRYAVMQQYPCQGVERGRKNDHNRNESVAHCV